MTLAPDATEQQIRLVAIKLAMRETTKSDFDIDFTKVLRRAKAIADFLMRGEVHNGSVLKLRD